MKQVKKRFNIEVEENTLVVKSFELDKNIKAIKGLLVTSNRDDLLYYRGTQKIEINKQEIFPDAYESKLLMSGINVPPKQRYYDMENFDPGNGIVKVSYKDEADDRAPWTPYRMSIYLDCVLEDNG